MGAMCRVLTELRLIPPDIAQNAARHASIGAHNLGPDTGKDEKFSGGL